jgi:hypothetical protein
MRGMERKRNDRLNYLKSFSKKDKIIRVKKGCSFLGNYQKRNNFLFNKLVELRGGG